MKHYEVSLIGGYHIEDGTVCQDSYYYKEIDKHFAIAAVSDGVGSEKHSEVASKIASETSVLYCFDHIKRDDSKETILEVIKKSFRAALDTIIKKVNEINDDIYQYDTTLALVVYIDGTVYFGNSGDSGILVLRNDGIFEAITTKQNDEYGSVYPLCFGEDMWEFGLKEHVYSVLLATDGIYDQFFPVFFKYHTTPIYAALAKYFMDDRALKFKDDEDTTPQKNMEKFLDSIPKNQISDDKTVVVMLDTSVGIDYQNDEYYQIPDIDNLMEQFKTEYYKKAYPTKDFETKKQDDSKDEILEDKKSI